jgi:hypothetical protein
MIRKSSRADILKIRLKVGKKEREKKNQII